MPIEDFIISVYCCVDENWYVLTEGKRLRQRGYAPKLTDQEVITMEIVGESLGIATDKGIWDYFRRHWLEWFPQLGSRANFSKQASALWVMKQRLQRQLLIQQDVFEDDLFIVDGFPMPVCLFARAKWCQLFKGEADYGYSAAKGETYYGFEGHIIISFQGLIVGYTLTAASVDERDALWDMTKAIRGVLFGDKGYIRPLLKTELAAQEELQLETPLRKNMNDTRDRQYVKCMNKVRRRIETVIGQLSERFGIERVWARDLWHLTNRLTRKFLADTVGVYFNRMQGNEPIQLEHLITA
jgi:hypothetical protein